MFLANQSGLLYSRNVLEFASRGTQIRSHVM